MQWLDGECRENCVGEVGRGETSHDYCHCVGDAADLEMSGTDSGGRVEFDVELRLIGDGYISDTSLLKIRVRNMGSCVGPLVSTASIQWRELTIDQVETTVIGVAPGCQILGATKRCVHRDDGPTGPEAA